MFLKSIARDSISKCSGCLDLLYCGFCVSSLQCIEGSNEGPSDGSHCPTWIHGNATACHNAKCTLAAQRVLQQMVVLGAVLLMHASLQVVFEPPCPPPYVQTTTVDGNLIVLGDASLGGGTLQ